MKFWEAMKDLEEGKMVKCKHWPEQCFMHPSQQSQCEYTGIIAWKDINGEWELCEEPEQTLSFAEVVKGLKEGKKFRRTSWDVYSVLTIHPSGVIDFTDTNEWGARPEDFEATDWVEVKE